MQEIHRVLAGASRRLLLTGWLRYSVLLLTAAAACAVALLLAERLGVLAALGVELKWPVLGAAGVLGAVGLGLIGAAVTRPGSQAVARRVDEAADLKDALATALYVDGANAGPLHGGGKHEVDRAWGANVIDSARRSAAGVRLSAAVPVRAPSYWYAPLVVMVVFAVLWALVPRGMDVLGAGARAQAKREDQEQAQRVQAQAQAAVSKAQSKIDEALEKLGEGEKKVAEKPEALASAQNPDEARRAAVKQLTGLQDQLKKLGEGQRAQASKSLMEKMKQLRATPGPLAEMTSQLARGNISQAQAELQSLAGKLAAGVLTPEQSQQVSAALKGLSEQLEKAGAERKALEKKLAEAGVDPSLADKPQALADALAKNDQLSEQQKQALKDAAQAQSDSQQACQSMAQAAGKLAEAMQQANQQGGQQGGQQASQQQNQALSDLAQAMSQVEMAQADLQSLEAAMNEASKQLSAMSESMGQCDNPGSGECQGGLGGQPGMAQGTQGQGEGKGEGGSGEGRGERGISEGGGGVGEAEAPEKWEKRKSRSPLGQGPMIGTMLVQGEQVKGESRAQLIEVTEKAAQQAAEAMEENKVPRELREAVKRYFGGVRSAASSGEAKKDEPKKDEKK
jgi:hypothetical protein